MRKLFYLLAATLLIFFPAVYIFIPNQIVVSKSELVESSERIIAAHLNYNRGRQKWWPAQDDIKTESKLAADTGTITLDGYQFHFMDPRFNLTEVLIKKGNLEIESVITWEAMPKNLMKITWIGTFTTSVNPFKRVAEYQKAVMLKKNMRTILDNLLGYIVSSENIYGFNFRRETVRDTVLATATINSKTYPGLPEIYNLIDSVKRFSKAKNAKQQNPPMLNISVTESGGYRTMIAIPINRVIEQNENIAVKRMVPGNILVVRVTGGPNTIEKAFDQMKIYMRDFKLTSPAIPFQSLVTNRIAEPDTAKWVTELYYPIF